MFSVEFANSLAGENINKCMRVTQRQHYEASIDVIEAITLPTFTYIHIFIIVLSFFLLRREDF